MIGVWSILLWILAAAGHGSAAVSHNPGAAGQNPPVIVIGFVGGHVHRDDSVHSVVQLAERLRKDYPSGVYAAVYENHRGDEAYETVLRLLDADDDGELSPQEKISAHVILYGHSWGASEAVTLARELEADDVPVLLTLQVDSVAKKDENDAVIPANVAEAANFFQPDGIVHGRAVIRAADPKRTQILGNFQFDYKKNPVHCDAYPWFGRTFAKTHIEIECDPAVWTRVERLIRSKLPPPARTEVSQTQSANE
ncbi:MAG TPA: hypothetical protein VEU52_09215 [Candidatus Limnocylindrales bacterium]|nr:hypothetical protein [Candidatus Limnocylindrales bacterium]